MKRSSHLLRAAAIGLAAMGCVGSIADASGTEGLESPGGRSPTSSPRGPGSTITTTAPSPDTRLRPLTRTEYVNTVRDLFFLTDVSKVASFLPSSVSGRGFDN